MIYIFLDDQREIKEIYQYGLYDPINEHLKNAKDKWIIVRSFEALTNLLVNVEEDAINNFVISMDHDLGEEKDGHDCLKWMVENLIIPKEIFFHSGNWTAVKEMESYWDSYKKSLTI